MYAVCRGTPLTQTEVRVGICRFCSVTLQMGMFQEERTCMRSSTASREAAVHSLHARSRISP